MKIVGKLFQRYKIVFFFICFLLTQNALAQSTWYSSGGGGDFTDTSIWWENDDGSGDNPLNVTSGDIFIIQDTDSVFLDDSTPIVSSLTVENGGIFQNSSNTLDVAYVNGGGSFTVNTGGTYHGSTGTIKFRIALGSNPTFSLQISQDDTLNNVTLEDGDLTISASGVLDVISIGGTLKIGSDAGSITTSTVTLAYLDNAIIEYALGADYSIGDEWTTDLNAASVTINSSGNTISVPSDNRTIGKTLTLTAGTLSIGNNTLTVLGDIASSDIAGSGSVTTGVSGIISVGDGTTQTIQTITGSPALSNLTINKGGTGTNDDVTVSGSPTITSDLTITDGDLIINGGITISSGDLNVNGGSVTNNGFLTISGGSNKILVAASASLATGTGATSITTNEIELASGASYSTGGKTITSLSILTLDANSTFEFNGTTVETTPLSSATFGNINMNNGGGLNINGTVTVNGTITFSKDATINTNASNILIMDGSASFFGYNLNRYVNGPLRIFVNDTGNQIFPIGTSSAYRPATFAWSGGSPDDTLQMEYLVTNPGGTPPTGVSSISSNGHYTLERRFGTTFGSYTITVRYTDTGFNPENRNRILIQNGAGPTYAALSSGQTHNEGTDDVTATITTGLPLVDFKVAFGAGGTTIRWAGDGDDDWHIAANWIPAAIPTSEDGVTIDSSISVVVRITGTNEAEAASLTIGEGTNSSELILNSSGANPLTVSGSLTVGTNSQLTVVDNTNAFSAGSTTFSIGSTVEYQDGNIPVDDYHDLNINGASGTTGSGTINVAGNLVKTGGAFTGTNTFDVTGVYTNTTGDATYNGGGLIVDGTPFSVTSGVVGGTIDINSTTTTVTGATGSFGGTVTFSHTAAQSVGGTGTIVFSTLEIDNGNGLTLNLPATATSLILTNGLINNGSNVLTLGSGSSGSSASYVNGPVAITNATGSQTFPIGKSSYRPVTTNLSSAVTPTVQFEVSDLAPNYLYSLPLVHISTVRYWLGTLTTGTITGGSVNLTYGPDDGVQTTSSLLMAYSADNSAAYTSLGGTGSGAPSGNITGTLSGAALGYFTLGTSASDNSLPVELSVFAAQPDYNMVKLTWVTESEIWNEGFNIYRRDVKEEDDWRLLSESMIPGQGNTSEKTTYEFVDRSVAAGQTYEYMLESISYAGVRVQEKVIEVLVPIPTEYVTLGNYPNPFNPTTNIGFRLPETSEVSIFIYGIQGNLVKELTLNQSFEAGDHFITWDATDNSGQQVASGMYVYLFSAGKYKKTEKMLLLK